MAWCARAAVPTLRGYGLCALRVSAASIPQGNSEADRLVRAVLSSGSGSDAGAGAQRPPCTTLADPVQALANLETMTIEAVFVLKDFHRHYG